MKKIAKMFSFLLAFVVLFASSASAQTPNMIYVGQASDSDGFPIQGVYGSLYALNAEGYSNYVAGTVSDSDGNVWVAPYNDDVIADGKYDFAVSGFDFLLVRRVLVIRNNQVVRGGGRIVMKPAMKDTSLMFDYDPATREIQWSFLVRGRVAFSPVLRIETIISTPAVTQEHTQFSMRQGQDYFGATHDSYENTMALESLKGLSDDEQAAWHPSDIGLDAPKPSSVMARPDYANYIQLPKSLPAGQFVCGNIVVSRTGDPTNIRSNRHSFCVRLEPKGFTGTPIVYTY